MNESLDENDLTPAEKEFERALSGLPAAQISLDAQNIWATSISRRGSHRLWFWRATSAALAASLLIVLWARRPSNAPPPTQIVYVHEATNPPAQPIAPTTVAAWSNSTEQNDLTDEQADNYLRMRQRVMQKGLNALTLPKVPAISDTGVPPVRARSRHATARPSQAPDAPADVERAIQPPPPGPVYRFINYLDKGSQL